MYAKVAEFNDVVHHVVVFFITVIRSDLVSKHFRLECLWFPILFPIANRRAHAQLISCKVLGTGKSWRNLWSLKVIENMKNIKVEILPLFTFETMSWV